MHALDDPNSPTPDEVEPSLCASCIFGAVVVVAARPDDGGNAPRQAWHTLSFCRNLTIAGGGTHEFESPVYACDKFTPDPAQEPPADDEQVPRAD